MSNFDPLITAWNRFATKGADFILATVVKTRGSSYRRPGAKMLVFPDGQREGIISGGCLEQDLVVRSLALLKSPETSSVIWYDTSRDDDVLFGSGIGCSGQTVILLEKINALPTWFHAKRALVVAKVFSSHDAIEFPIGHSWVCHDKVKSCLETAIGQADQAAVAQFKMDKSSDISNNIIEKTISERLTKSRENSRSEIIEINSGKARIEVFFEFIPTPLSLAVFGAGDDAVPLVSLARQLNWDVSVYDWRPAFALENRFAAGTKSTLIPFENLQHESIGLQANAAVIMSHSLSNDLCALRFVLTQKTNSQYIGILGPRIRTERLLQELESEENSEIRQVKDSNSTSSKLHYPAGLDIGAETPTEIAISIIAEIKASIAGRTGRLLSERQAPIHDQLDEQQIEFKRHESAIAPNHDHHNHEEKVCPICPISAQ